MNTPGNSAGGTDSVGADSVRCLTPATTTIFEGIFSLLHCAVKGDTVYRGVFAVRMFPVRFPDKYISLRYTDVTDKDRDREIGVIEDLSVFPEDQRNLVSRSLAAQYHEQIVRRICDIRCEYGFLFFDVETQRGREEFIMPWRSDRGEEYGEKGKVLLDAFDNRYIIPNVENLPVLDQRRFSTYIYW